jgi:hypothetical protein
LKDTETEEIKTENNKNRINEKRQKKRKEKKKDREKRMKNENLPLDKVGKHCVVRHEIGVAVEKDIVKIERQLHGGIGHSLNVLLRQTTRDTTYIETKRKEKAFRDQNL